MTGVKISNLPAAVSAQDTDQIETNQGGVSRRVTVDQLAERIAASDQIADVIDGAIEEAAIGGLAVSLEDFIASPNPLQAAFDFLGPAGGTIIVPDKTYSIPGRCVAGVDYATSNLNNMAIIGEGVKSSLVFPNGGGICLYFFTPRGDDHAPQLCHVERLSIITSQATNAATGSGTGLAISFFRAVGDVTSGVVLRDVQVGNQSQYGHGVMHQWWNTCIQLYNARQVTLANVYTVEGSYDVDASFAVVPPRGNGIDCNGGTVQIQFSDINCAGHIKGVYVNGVAEGVQWNRGVTIGCTHGVYFDGDADGRARSTSSTSNAIGTGSKTFTVPHNIEGPDGLAWTTDGGWLMVRDTANPTVNWMQGPITGATRNTVTINVINVGGSGTKTSWTISTEHAISQNTMHAIHHNNRERNYFLRWTAFTNIHDCMTMTRDDPGFTDPFWHIEIAHENSCTFIHDMTMSGGAVNSQTKGGIWVRGTYPTGVWNTTGNNARNYYIHINDIQFTDSSYTTGVLLEENIGSVDVSALMMLGNTVSGKVVDNRVTSIGTNGIKVWGCLDAWNGVNAWHPFATNSATPNTAMDGFNRWRTANTAPTTITSFVGGAIGETFDLLINDTNTTINHNASVFLRDAANYVAPIGTVMKLIRETDTLVREVNRSPFLLHNFRSIAVSNDVNFGGGIANGFTWGGWLYQTQNLAAAPFDAGWNGGLALGWNYSAGGEMNYILRTGGAHKFQWKLGASAVQDADITFRFAASSGTIPPASNDTTVPTTAWVRANISGGGGTGTVTSTSVVSANGLAGTVANATTTPAITLSTTVNGMVKGNGTTLSAATAGSDYMTPALVALAYLPLAGGTLTGPLAGTTATLSGAVTAGTGAVGKALLSPGDATHAGYLGIFDHAGARQGYIGFAEGNMTYNADVGVHNFQQALTGTTATFTDLSLVSPSGLSSLEMSGPGGSYIDLKSPTSDDYDIRLATTGSGGYIAVPSGATLQLFTDTVALNGALTGTTATFSGAVQGGNYRTGDGSFVFTPFNGSTDTATVRAGIVFNGGGQAVGVHTANTLRAYWDSAGVLNLLGSLSGTTATFTGVVSTNGFTAGYLEIPQNAQTGNYTAVLADAGKHIYHAVGAGAGDVYTIPANSSVAYPIGTTLTFINDDATNSVSIQITTDTMVLSPGTTTGSRTLATGGVATAIKVTSTRWIINGTGLT